MASPTCFPCSPAADEYSCPSWLSCFCPTLAAFPPGPTGSALKPWRHRTSHPATGDTGSPAGSQPGSKNFSAQTGPSPVPYVLIFLHQISLQYTSKLSQQDLDQDFLLLCCLSTGRLKSADTRLRPCWPVVLSCSGLSGAGNSSFSQLGSKVPFKLPLMSGIVLQVRGCALAGRLALTLQPVVSGWLDILSLDSVLHQKFDSFSSFISNVWYIEPFCHIQNSQWCADGCFLSQPIK